MNPQLTEIYDPSIKHTVPLQSWQQRATDPDFIKARPADAILDAYRPGSGGMMYNMGRNLRDWYDNSPSPVSDWVNQGPGHGAALGALLGIPALLGTALFNKLTGSDLSTTGIGLTAAGIGAGVGAASGAARQPQVKAAGWRAPGTSINPKMEINQLLQSAPGLSFQDRTSMSLGVNQLTQEQARELLEMLGTVGGAGIGALIAKFLMHAGFLGTMAGAAVGGWLGNAFSHPRSYSSVGLPNSNKTYMGYDYDL